MEKFVPAAMITEKNTADLEERVLQEHAEVSRRELDDVKVFIWYQYNQTVKFFSNHFMCLYMLNKIMRDAHVTSMCY